MIDIKYRDRYLVVCVKPPKVDSEHEMPELLQKQLGVDRVLCTHRLDRDVGGLLICALDGKTAAGMTEQFAGKALRKEYLAVTDVRPAEEASVLKDLLFHDTRTNKTFVVDRMRRGVREAILRDRVIGYAEDLSLTLHRILLETGRSHQIRVQLGSRGMPLLGDARYGSKDRSCGIALWSWHMAFLHPVTKVPVDITAAPPDSYPWNCFHVEQNISEEG